jgi:hypothetical protein
LSAINIPDVYRRSASQSWAALLGGTLEVLISIESHDPGGEIASLWDWLHGERALGGRIRAGERKPDESQLGSTIDVISVAVASGGAATVLASSLATWLQSRRSDVTITIEKLDRSVRISALRVKDPLLIIQELLQDDDDS